MSLIICNYSTYSPHEILVIYPGSITNEMQNKLQLEFDCNYWTQIFNDFLFNYNSSNKNKIKYFKITNDYIYLSPPELKQKIISEYKSDNCIMIGDKEQHGICLKYTIKNSSEDDKEYILDKVSKIFANNENTGIIGHVFVSIRGGYVYFDTYENLKNMRNNKIKFDYLEICFYESLYGNKLV